MQIIICQTPVLDEFRFSSSISAFAATEDYTITDLMTTSQQTVQAQLSTLDESESEFVSAFYTCQNSDCTLFEVRIRVFVQRKMECLVTSDDAFADTVTNLSFDIANDELSAVTYLREDDRRDPLSWGELPVSIDEIIQIALEEAAGAEYARQHPEFELRVSLLRDQWGLAFRSGATTVPDLDLSIDTSGRLITN